MKNRLLSRIFTFYPRENHNPKENFLTEVLAYCLSTVPQFNQSFLNLINNKLKLKISYPEENKHKWTTQFRMSNGNIPDLVYLDAEFPKIIFEIKIDSPLGKHQIERYKEELRQIDKEIPVIMIARSDSQNTQSADALITWTDIYLELISIQRENLSVNNWIIDETINLLETIKVIDMIVCREDVSNYSKNYFNDRKIESALVNSLFNIHSKISASSIDNINIRPPFLPPIFESKSGVLGLRWSKGKNKSKVKDWKPSVFMGIVLDPGDYALNDICKNEIPFIVSISINKSLYHTLQKIKEWGKFKCAITSSLSEGWMIIDRTYGSPNPSQPFILYKPLSSLFGYTSQEVSAEKIFENCIKGMLPIIQRALDHSKLPEKLEEL